MKFKLLTFITIILQINLYSQINDTIEKLIQSYSLVRIDSSIENKTNFFNNFPSNFTEFRKTYGYGDDLSGPHGGFAPLYCTSYAHIDLFCSLCEFIPKEQYYKKIIDISIDGYYQVDAVFYFKDRCFFENTCDIEYFLSILEKYDDKKISSFWHFYFDNIMVLDSFKEFYQKTSDIIKSHNRLFRIMKKEYRKALLERKRNIGCGCDF